MAPACSIETFCDLRSHSPAVRSRVCDGIRALMIVQSVCVYCASNPGTDTAFAAAATSLGSLLAKRDLRVVYGGGHVGLMGVLADAAIAQGGQVVGVITRALVAKGVAHQGLRQLLVVDTMHQRKAAMADMADMADGFMMLPGRFGTLDEFFEAVTPPRQHDAKPKREPPPRKT